MKLINGVITEILDPQLYFSRFSFLESNRDAIELKQKRANKQQFLPQVKGKYYTRSALVKSLIPIPSEGKVRAVFQEKSPQAIAASVAGSGRKTSPVKLPSIQKYSVRAS